MRSYQYTSHPRQRKNDLSTRKGSPVLVGKTECFLGNGISRILAALNKKVPIRAI